MVRLLRRQQAWLGAITDSHGRVIEVEVDLLQLGEVFWMLLLVLLEVVRVVGVTATEYSSLRPATVRRRHIYWQISDFLLRLRMLARVLNLQWLLGLLI